jgi:hypothetical protein
MRFCTPPVRSQLLWILLPGLIAAACSSDPASGSRIDGPSSDVGAGSDGTTEGDTSSVDLDSGLAEDTETTADVPSPDAVSVDATPLDGETLDADAPDTVLVDVEPDGDGLIPSDFEPGPLPDPGGLPLGYSDTPPAGADSAACATSQWWSRGDRESNLMHPGGDCTSCHNSRREGPIFSIAGTVMPDYDAAEDCRGVTGPVVEIYGSSGTLLQTLRANSVGNFFSERRIAADQLPYTARVIYDGRVREMFTPQTSGQCNSCHTAIGANGAPGRIVLP